MPKLTIHCELQTPDGEHADVTEAICVLEQLSPERRDALILSALNVAEFLPAHVAGLIAIGACIASGKNTITSRPE